MLQYSGEKASDVGCGRNATIQKERYAAIHKLIFRKGVNRGVLHFMRFVPAIYFSFFVQLIRHLQQTCNDIRS